MALNSMKIFRWITWVLLVAMILILAGLAVIRVSQKRPSQAEVNTDHIFGDTGAATIGVSNEFKYVEQVRGQMIFALEALRTLGKSSGWYDIEGVAVQLFGEDQSKGPLLTCQNASFNIDSKDARLTGSVQVEFPDGSFFSTEIGMLLGGGRRFESGSGVTFVSDRFLGRAGSVDYDMANEVLRLGDGVVVRSGEGHSLTAPDVEFWRGERRVVLPRGGNLVFGPINLTAPAGVIDLEEDSRMPRRVVFSGGVTILGTDPGSDQIVQAWAETFETERDAANQWQVHASTLGPWVEVAFFGGENLLYQKLRTWNLKAVVDDSGILNMFGDGQVCMESISKDGQRRTSESGSLRVWFNEGETSDAELQKEVVINQDDMVATAHRARVDATNEQVLLHGNPVGRSARVTLESKQGRLSADQALLSRVNGEAEARGRVQGEMFDVSLVGDTGSNGKDTDSVNVACGVLTVADGGGEFHLRDGARVWQGLRLLVADDIKYLPDSKTVEARGHARTTFPASMLDPDSKAVDDVVLSARSITFDEARGRAVYRGDVTYKDGRQSMAAALLEIEVQDGTVRSVVATGSVEIESAETGQRLTGNKVVHEVLTGDFFLTGQPAQAVDKNGNMLSGRSLTFNQASGRVSVADETETIYHPEEEP